MSAQSRVTSRCDVAHCFREEFYHFLPVLLRGMLPLFSIMTLCHRVWSINTSLKSHKINFKRFEIIAKLCFCKYDIYRFDNLIFFHKFKYLNKNTQAYSCRIKVIYIVIFELAYHFDFISNNFQYLPPFFTNKEIVLFYHALGLPLCLLFTPLCHATAKFSRNYSIAAHALCLLGHKIMKSHF